MHGHSMEFYQINKLQKVIWCKVKNSKQYIWLFAIVNKQKRITTIFIDLFVDELQTNKRK
jgi:ribulose bisphosphate carboxylase small subunit